jgi:hypothetical protein
MEFFEIADVATSAEELRSKVGMDSLPFFCEEIEAVDAAEELGRVVYFRHWGRFHLRQETVLGGIRFSVPDCPNALAWTLTTGFPPEPGKIVLHATINRNEHDPDFLAATRALLAALKEGLEKNFAKPGPADRNNARPFRIPCL